MFRQYLLRMAAFYIASTVFIFLNLLFGCVWMVCLHVPYLWLVPEVIRGSL